MDSGYYAAMTGLVARTQALDAAASNLANAQTPGFRAEREYFRSALLGPDTQNSQLGRTVNNFGLLGGSHLSQAEGAIQQTGNPLDLAIKGEGFFAIQTSNGIRYTRDGEFHKSSGGQLVTSNGEPVLSASLKPILMPPGPASVSADGVLSISGGIVAEVGVFTFPIDSRLVPEGANRYALQGQSVAQLSKDASIHAGATESANQDVIQGSLELLVMQRQAEMMQKALTIFHTEFNKIAIEDLPRI